MVADGAAASGVPLSAGDAERNRRLRYVNYADVRISHGVRVLLALAPSQDGSVVLFPASHNRSTPPPTDFLAGADDLDMTEEVNLEAGDLLICAATLLHGVRGRPGD
jgi:ectoine hydroxylase-related dioxygenase (phytanoyl-CoA dioxygenase family)